MLRLLILFLILQGLGKFAYIILSFFDLKTLCLIFRCLFLASIHLLLLMSV